MKDAPNGRQPMWTESIAVGDEDYVRETKKTLAAMAIGREIAPTNSAYALRETRFPYGVHFDAKNNDLRPRNTFYWNTSHGNTNA